MLGSHLSDLLARFLETRLCIFFWGVGRGYTLIGSLTSFRCLSGPLALKYTKKSVKSLPEPPASKPQKVWKKSRKCEFETLPWETFWETFLISGHKGLRDCCRSSGGSQACNAQMGVVVLGDRLQGQPPISTAVRLPFLRQYASH